MAIDYDNRKSLYSTKAWYRLRHHQLKKEPCCTYCNDVGHVVMATVVDHIEPHKGDEILFFDEDNLQSLCKTHHDSTKKREELSGHRLGGKESGYPIDPQHHWNDN